MFHGPAHHKPDACIPVDGRVIPAYGCHGDHGLDGHEPLLPVGLYKNLVFPLEGLNGLRSRCRVYLHWTLFINSYYAVIFLNIMVDNFLDNIRPVMLSIKLYDFYMRSECKEKDLPLPFSCSTNLYEKVCNLISIICQLALK